MAVARGPILPQYNRQTVRAEEWLSDQQNFQGVDKAVVAALAQACRSEDISEGQKIQSRGQKLQDLLILREGKALQENQPDAQGRGAASPVHCILNISHHKSSHATSYDGQGCTILAGPGEILGLQDLLLQRELESSIVAKSNVVVWRVPSKTLKATLRNYPDLSLHLFRLAFGKLEDRTEQLQVGV